MNKGGSLAGVIELVKLNRNGVIWVKLIRDIFGRDRDLYLCLTYIPPEDSTVYKTIDSDLYTLAMALDYIQT